GIGSDWLQAAKDLETDLPLVAPKTDRALIIFAKNPVLGKVKTRLAKTIGDQAAFEAYLQMLAHVRSVTAETECHRAVFYTDFVDENDAWSRPAFSKHLQASGDLGERMHAAISTLLKEGFQKVVLVGSDLLDLQVQHLEQAFRALEFQDFVLGPAGDGGYYLVGMKTQSPWLFEGRTWSTATVLAEALQAIRERGFSVHLLPELSDIDDEKDWFAAQQRHQARQKAT
ncbi:MAG TPA: TIGR04282 family arsenosugar biosynthesis glycosyltransferase, partial [Bacteroidia bacterium]|nr:TIGR04282 family arsenosugar biosynthesis glycosyltransferase [Bacteroidia bacterium]